MTGTRFLTTTSARVHKKQSDGAVDMGRQKKTHASKEKGEKTPLTRSQTALSRVPIHPHKRTQKNKGEGIRLGRFVSRGIPSTFVVVAFFVFVYL